MSVFSRILNRSRNTAPDRLEASEVAFVVCVEANRLEPQARLLCESIRRFGGEYARSRIIAISPRPHLAIGAETKAFFRDLDVSHFVEPLNVTGSEYGTINRIVASAWAEANCRESFIVALDTDMFFAAAPVFVRADAGVRPVDFKGAASTGPGDEVDGYWGAMAELASIDLDRIPFLQTSIDRQSIRASYNGGFVIARRDARIYETTRNVFFRSYDRGLRPAANGSTVHTSTGLSAEDVAQWWGSSQAALSVAIWSRTEDVKIYPPAYNIPLHAVSEGAPWPLESEPVLIHYHYLAEPEYRLRLMDGLRRVQCSGEAMRWVERAVTVFD